MPHRLNSYFTGQPELRGLVRQAQRLTALDELYRSATPATLAKTSRVIGLEQQILIIGADNGAIAAKLRHLIPNILNQIQKGSAEITGIRVKVQVNSAPAQPHAVPHAMSEKGRQSLTDFAASLDNSPLKSALQRLIRR